MTPKQRTAVIALFRLTYNLDENGNILGGHLSSTLDWLEQDLLSKVPFDKEKDTYTKNW